MNRVLGEIRTAHLWVGSLALLGGMNCEGVDKELDLSSHECLLARGANTTILQKGTDNPIP